MFHIWRGEVGILIKISVKGEIITYPPCTALWLDSFIIEISGVICEAGPEPTPACTGCSLVNAPKIFVNISGIFFYSTVRKENHWVSASRCRFRTGFTNDPTNFNYKWIKWQWSRPPPHPVNPNKDCLYRHRTAPSQKSNLLKPPDCPLEMCKLVVTISYR